MRKIEQAIRHAFSQIDVSDASKRQQVYKAIWQAHENSLMAGKTMDRQTQNKKRAQLSHIIKTIEAGFHPEDDTLGKISPAAERSSRSSTSIGPEEESNGMPNTAADAGKWRRHEHKRSRLGTRIAFFILLAITLFVVWSFYNSLTGNLPAGLQASSSAPLRQDNENPDGWIRVFDPSSASTLSIQGAATAKIHNEVDTNFVRIHINNSKDAAVIEIGQGVLMDMRGKTAIFNIIARSAGKKNTQVSITCDFGNDYITGRHRFEVPTTRENLLFRIEVPQTIDGPAKLYISSDLPGKNSEIDIFSVLAQTEK